MDMEGRAVRGRVASTSSLDDRVDHLVPINAASRFREHLLFPTTLAVVLVLARWWPPSIVVPSSATGARRWRAVIAFVALADLAALPVSYLARAFPLEDLGLGFYWSFLVVGSRS